ncbi:MAG: glycosyltransferase, partial [Candidatus Nanoarchaeia archaeon]
MDNIGGAEKVDLILARELGADIYTTNIDKAKIKKMGFNADNIYSIGKIPSNAPFKQEMAYRKFRKLNLGKKYDFYLIAGDWAMSSAVNNKPNLWYVYSPIREIWDLYEYTKKNNVPFGAKKIFDFWVSYHRKINRRNIGHVGKIISISKNVQKRVKKYLGRDSSVVYPPTETSKFYYKKNENYWLSVSRLINHKRIDMQIRAFEKMPDEKLIIVGSYEKSRHFKKYADYIKKIKPDNVEILSWVDNKKLIKLYANCKGFITTSKNEDYGMNVVEAMASGKPVIAPDEGGYKETIVNGKTGLLIKEINEDKIADAVKKISENPEKYKNECLKQAKKFDVKIFVRKIKKILEDELKNTKIAIPGKMTSA